MSETPITPAPNASKRTKERCRQHGPFQRLTEGRCATFGDQTCLLLRSNKTDWLGWIPKNEITEPAIP